MERSILLSIVVKDASITAKAVVIRATGHRFGKALGRFPSCSLLFSRLKTLNHRAHVFLRIAHLLG